MSHSNHADIRIALMDDHTLFRAGLRHLLEREGGFSVVAEASTLDQALALCKNNEIAFDLALIDFQFNDDTSSRGEGMKILQALRAQNPTAAAIILTGGLPEDALLEVVSDQRTGIFLKSEPLEKLLPTIWKSLRGEMALSDRATEAVLAIAQQARPAVSPASFNDRELLVLRLVTDGLSNKEIAVQLDTSESNVKAILQKLFAKTGVRSRSQLVRYVFEFDLGFG